MFRRAIKGATKIKYLMHKYGADFKRAATYSRQSLRRYVTGYKDIIPGKNLLLRYYRFQLPDEFSFQRRSVLWGSRSATKGLDPFVNFKAWVAYFDTGRALIARCFASLNVYNRKPFERRNSSMSFMARLLAHNFLKTKTNIYGRIPSLAFFRNGGKTTCRFLIRHLVTRTWFRTQSRLFRTDV